MSRGLVFLAAGCFAVVAAAHLFEAFGLFSAAGWGQPHSLGHYVDLGAALLALVLAAGAAVLPLVRRARR